MDNSIEEQGEETIVGEKITLMSEVLMYTNHYRNSSSKDSLVKVMSTAFTEVDLKVAKDMLWEAFTDMDILGVNHDRRDSSNRTYMMAISEDIVSALNGVGDSVYDLVSYAVNPTKIPKMNPESANEESVAEQLAEMEAKFKIYRSTLSELKVESIKAADKIASVEKECQAHGSVLKGLVNKDKSPRSSTIEWPTLRCSNPESFQP